MIRYPFIVMGHTVCVLTFRTTTVRGPATNYIVTLLSHLHLRLHGLCNPPKDRRQKRNALLNPYMVTQQYSGKSQTQSPEDTLHTTLNVAYDHPTYVDT